MPRTKNENLEFDLEISRTNNPYSKLKTRRMIYINRDIKVCSHWERDLLLSLSGENKEAVAVPSLSSGGNQEALLEKKFPNLWTREDREHRIRYFNRCSALSIKSIDDPNLDIFAVDSLNVPFIKKLRNIHVESTVVEVI